MNGLLIVSVTPDSPADRAGLRPGQYIVSVNGTKLRDIIDYTWLMYDGQPALAVADENGTQQTVTLDTAPGETPGLSFSPPETKRCGNNCMFCFVHQLPKGLRRPLYVKDEDYRLSFLQGTFVTLTGLKRHEMQRIISQRLSPLYISVHATDPDLRKKLLGKEQIPPILEQLKELASARIQMHTQIVLCPGFNDGDALEKTVQDLAALYPAVQSLAVVPVGLTDHRAKLPLLAAVDTDYAAAFLDKWLPLSRKLNRQLGEPFLQLADEFFLKAGYSFPPLKEYGDLPQWENGVGMIPWFLKDASAVLRRARPLAPLNATVVTGISAAGVVGRLLDELSEKTGCCIKTAAIPNLLFGKNVTVTGLVTGMDIITELEGSDKNGLLLVPSVMLKEGEGCFLDDMTPEDVGRKLGMQVHTFEPAPSELYRLLQKLSGKQKRKLLQVG